MTPTASHLPKLRAIEALHAGKLSGAGRTRLSRHLSGCEPCRQTLHGLRVHEQLTRVVRAETPVVDFARMELALRAEARSATRRVQKRRWAPWLAVAAAALLVVTLRWQDTRTAHAPMPPKPAIPTPPTAQSLPLAAYVTVLHGEGEVRRADGTKASLTIQSTLAEGDTVSLLPQGHVEVQLDEGTGLALEAQSAAEFRALRTDAIEVGLDAGAVTNRVRALGAGERYRVVALGYTVEVRGTLFRVAVESSGLSVDVDEGHVVVTDSLGHLVADLVAPARYRSTPGASGETTTRPLRAPRLTALPLSAWPALTLPKLSGIAEWNIDGHAAPAGTELAMRVPRGDVTLIAKLTDGRERRHVLAVPEGGAVVDEVHLRSLLEVEPPAQRTTLDAQTLQHVIANGTPALQRCYERSLKQHSVSGRLTLRFVLDARGRVRSVAPLDPASDMPDGLLACIRQSARRWQFPAPGSGGITFDAPIRLASGH